MNDATKDLINKLNAEAMKHSKPFVVKSCEHIKPGDTVVRMLAGTVPMTLTVESVDETLIYAKGGWTFDRKTGAEVDDDLGWGPDTMTGSFLVPNE